MFLRTTGFLKAVTGVRLLLAESSPSTSLSRGTALSLNLPLRFSPWMTGHARSSLGGSRDIRFAA